MKVIFCSVEAEVVVMVVVMVVGYRESR